MDKVKSSYYKNMLVLVTGSGISHVVPLLFTPILTRLYSPSDYGVFVFFLSLLSVTSMISTGRYHLAIILPKQQDEADILKSISLMLSFIFMFFLFIVIYICYQTSLFNNIFSRTNNLIFLLPLATLFFSFFDIINYVLNREKEYNKMGRIRIFRSFISESSSLLFGLLSLGYKGLIVGSLLGNLSPLLFFDNKLYERIQLSKNNIKSVMKKYSDFPLYQMPTSILGSFSLQSPIFFFTAFYPFHLHIVGFVGLALRLFSFPLSLFTRSISQVFYKESSELHNQNQDLNNVFYDTLKTLTIIGFPIATILFVFSESLFYYIFGQEWVVAGTYVKYLTPAFFIRFIVSPLTPIFFVKEKIKILSVWKVIQFISTGTVLFLCCMFINVENIDKTIIIYSIHEVILYMICFILQIRIL